MKVFFDGFRVDGENRIIHFLNGLFKGKVAITGGVYDETFTSPTEDQVVPLRFTNKRGLHANLRDSAGNEINNYSGTGLGGLTGRGIDVAGVVALGTPITLGELAFGSITGSYTTLYAGFNKSRIVWMVNGSNQPVYLSRDGTLNHFRLEAVASMTIDLGPSWVIFASGDLSVKHAGVAPTSGSVYVMAIQGPSGE